MCRSDGGVDAQAVVALSAATEHVCQRLQHQPLYLLSSVFGGGLGRGIWYPLQFSCCSPELKGQMHLRQQDMAVLRVSYVRQPWQSGGWWL